MDFSDVIDNYEIEGPGPLDAAAFGEYVHHLISRASELVAATGHSASSTGAALEVSLNRFRLSGSSMGAFPDLLVGRSGTQVDLWVLITAEAERAGIEVWAEAAVLAAGDLGSRRETFAWSALIGGYPEFSSDVPRLAEPTHLGAIELRPLDAAVTELVPGPIASLSVGGAIKTFWPVVVDGEVESFSWQGPAEQQTAATVQLVCACLTVATEMCWKVREAAVPLAGDARFSGWAPPAIRPDLGPPPEVPPYTALELPDWVSSGWTSIERDNRLERATRMFHEALSLIDDHPSFALVGFTSVIESVYEGPERLGHCETCNSPTGSTRRFKAAVRSVLPAEATDLLEVAYQRRSRSVHSSRLHGEEVHRGSYPIPLMFSPDESFKFRWETLRYTKDAARALLRNRLQTSTGDLD